MNKRFIPVLLFIGYLITSLNGQVISKPESRSTLLDGMQETLTNQDRPEGDYSEVNSPFEAKIFVKPAPVVQEVEEVPRVISEVLADDKALSIISQQFNPLGSLVLGSRGVLQLTDDRTIEKGASFKAQINGNDYNVTILDVTTKGYTLGLGTAQISKNFLTTSGTAE